MISPELLTEITTRHQIYLERIKTGEFNKYEPFLKRIAKLIRFELSGQELTEFKRDRLEKLIKSINQDIKLVQGEYIDVLNKSSLELAKYEAGFEARSLDQVVEYDFTIPTDNQLKSAVLTNPLTAKGANGKLLMAYYDDTFGQSVNNVTNAIRSGYYEGLTTPQIIKNIIGTRSHKFTDGELYNLNRSTEMAVKTGLQHVSVQAREETWRSNQDIIKGVKWTSTLDGRTSAICRTLDSQIFPIDKGPRPPAHNFCRSSVVAELDDRFAILKKDATRSARDANGKVISVDADMSYYDWLKTQSPDFQDSVIGKTRGLLLRDGGLTSQRFSELQLSKTFRPLTLAGMRKLEPLAFSKIATSSVDDLIDFTIDLGSNVKYNKLVTDITIESKHVIDKIKKPASIVTGKGRYYPTLNKIQAPLKSDVLLHEYGHHIDNMLQKGEGHYSALRLKPAYDKDQAFLKVGQPRVLLHKLTSSERSAYFAKQGGFDENIESLRDKWHTRTKLLYTRGKRKGKVKGFSYLENTPATGAFSDIVDSLSGGRMQSKFRGVGHGSDYYNAIKSGMTNIMKGNEAKQTENFANLFYLWSDKTHWNEAKKLFPSMTKEFELIMGEVLDGQFN